jgi:LCP family protein required for cell wall assembly
MAAQDDWSKGVSMKKLAAIISLALLIAFSGILLALGLAARPLGPSLALQTTASASPTASNQPAATPACGQGGKMALLVLGLSSPQDRPRRGADAIRLVQLDFDAPAARILSLPPDLWVPSPALEASSAPSTTLTLAYWTAKSASESEQFEERAAAGTQGLAQTLYDQFHYQPDHYITISQTAFVEMVDSLGGIQMNLSQAILEAPAGWSRFEAGEQTLDGKQTLDYARLLYPSGQSYTGERERLERQDRVLVALQQAIQKPENWARIPELSGKFREAVATDLSPSQLLDLVCLARQVGEGAEMLAPSAQMMRVDASGRLQPDPAAFLKLFDQLNGRAPE